MIVRAPADPVGMYGWEPNVSSWGGAVVRADAGMYHLFVAEMKTGGLAGWQKNSECTHAVSDTPAGPYHKVGEALTPECHNPSIIRDRGPRNTGEYLLFHVGKGNSSAAGASSFMHHASSLDGAWKAAPTGVSPCGNPAPAFHPNGTLFVVCNHFDLTHTLTDDGWRGEWAPLRSMTKTGGDTARHWEGE